MEVPVTIFRKQIFDLLGRAQRGESIAVSYKGERFHIVPEHSPVTRFDRLTPMQITNPAMPDLDDEAANDAMKAEMLAAWEQKWARR
jgi:antitoxin (DNA-binding transcriptional repressor) of toxin-antitoxin stability system